MVVVVDLRTVVLVVDLGIVVLVDLGTVVLVGDLGTVVLVVVPLGVEPVVVPVVVPVVLPVVVDLGKPDCAPESPLA